MPALAIGNFDDVDGDVRFVPGWCLSEDTLEDTKRRTHDAVLDQLGDRRTSGVAWLIREGVDDGNALLDTFVRVVGPGEMFDLLRRLRAFLREYGGIVVVAMAKEDA